MRPVLVLLLAACSNPPATGCDPGDVRTCTCSSGGPGAELCLGDRSFGPCECLYVDGGLDAGTDAGELDAGRDAGTRDGGLDAGPRDAGPPEGECWLVEQLGCRPGQSCRRTPASAPLCSVCGPPACQPDGLLGEWDNTRNCNSGEPDDRCQAGLFCLGFGRCARFCDPDGAPCPPDPRGNPQRCVLTEPLPDYYCSPQ